MYVSDVVASAMVHRTSPSEDSARMRIRRIDGFVRSSGECRNHDEDCMMCMDVRCRLQQSDVVRELKVGGVRNVFLGNGRGGVVLVSLQPPPAR